MVCARAEQLNRIQHIRRDGHFSKKSQLPTSDDALERIVISNTGFRQSLKSEFRRCQKLNDPIPFGANEIESLKGAHKRAGDLVDDAVHR